jgi:hypothetical protein
MATDMQLIPGVVLDEADAIVEAEAPDPGLGPGRAGAGRISRRAARAAVPRREAAPPRWTPARRYHQDGDR